MPDVLYGGCTHLDVSFSANLQRTPPTGHVIPEARDLHRRLGVALERLDGLIAANTLEARAA